MMLGSIREHSLFGSGLKPSGWESMTGHRISCRGAVSPETHVMAMDEEESIESTYFVSLIARLDVLGMLIGRSFGHQLEAMTHASQKDVFPYVEENSQGGETGNAQASIREL